MIENRTILWMVNEVLSQQILLLMKISDGDYIRKSNVLDHANIGGHTRHILEFFEQLISDYEKGTVNYEKRKRNLEMETNPKFAIEKTREILSKIDIPDKVLKLEHSMGTHHVEISTSFERELLYNIEHTIHHQALIKVGLNEMEIGNLVNESFGVAPSTIKYRELQKN